jgi:hypothetical protein
MSLAIIHAAMRPNSILQEKFESQVVVEAGIICLESPSVDNHANRLIWANKVIGSTSVTFSPQTSRLLLLNALALNSTAQMKGNELTDSEIEYIVRTTQLANADLVAVLNAA